MRRYFEDPVGEINSKEAFQPQKNTTLFSEIPWTSPGRSSINCQKHELKYKTEKYKTERYITG